MVISRVVVGLTLAAHGSQKSFGSFGGSGTADTQKFFAGLGFRRPLAMAFIAGSSELPGLLFGLVTPVAALALAVVMINAIGTVHVFGWAERISGPWWALAIAVVAPISG